jgi:hypothetical protein
MTQKTSVTRDEALVEPVILKEADQVIFQIWVPGVTSSISSPTMKWYKANIGSDLSSTYLTGSMSVVGTDIIQTKQTTALKAGSWVMSISATVDGLTYVVATVPVIVKRENEL